MKNTLQTMIAGNSLPLRLRQAADDAGWALTAFASEALRMYRIGGLVGVLLGVCVSIVTAQTRRLGR